MLDAAQDLQRELELGRGPRPGPLPEPGEPAHTGTVTAVPAPSSAGAANVAPEPATLVQQPAADHGVPDSDFDTF